MGKESSCQTLCESVNWLNHSVEHLGNLEVGATCPQNLATPCLGMNPREILQQIYKELWVGPVLPPYLNKNN